MQQPADLLAEVRRALHRAISRAAAYLPELLAGFLWFDQQRVNFVGSRVLPCVCYRIAPNNVPRSIMGFILARHSLRRCISKEINKHSVWMRV